MVNPGSISAIEELLQLQHENEVLKKWLKWAIFDERCLHYGDRSELDVILGEWSFDDEDLWSDSPDM